MSEDISSDTSSDDVFSDESSEDTSSDESSDDVSEDTSSNESSNDTSSDDSSEPEWEIPEISVYDFVFNIDSVNGIIYGEDTIIITSNDFYYACYPMWSTTIILDRINDMVYSVNSVIDNPYHDYTNVNLKEGQIALVVHSAGDRPQDDNGIYENWEARAVARALKIGDKLILDKVVLTDNSACINGTATVKESTDTSPDPVPEHGTNGIIYKLGEDGTYCYIDSYIGTDNNVTIPSVYMGLPVTEIRNNAFENLEIAALIIPKSITNIGQNAFNGCFDLTEIYCEAEAQPDGFSEYWLGSSDTTVLWGYTYDVAMEECESWIDIYNSLVKEEYCEAEWNNLQDVLNSANIDLSAADTIFKLRPIIKSLEYAHLINPKIKEFADINDDEVIDVFDYLLLKRYCFKTYQFDEVQYSRGNIDRNDTIDVFDFLLLKRIAFKSYVVQ